MIPTKVIAAAGIMVWVAYGVGLWIIWRGYRQREKLVRGERQRRVEGRRRRLSMDLDSAMKQINERMEAMIVDRIRAQLGLKLMRTLIEYVYTRERGRGVLLEIMDDVVHRTREDVTEGVTKAQAQVELSPEALAPMLDKHERIYSEFVADMIDVMDDIEKERAERGVVSQPRSA